MNMNDKDLMREAVRLSVENVGNGGGPFGAVITRDGKIIATGTNRVTSDNDPTAHAEVSAIRNAARTLGTFGAWRAKDDKVKY
jgi:guanine deaminase